MLKNPYVSRAFGHLFDLVRLVMRSESRRMRLTTRRISTRTIRALISENKKEQMGSSICSYLFDILEFEREQRTINGTLLRLFV